MTAPAAQPGQRRRPRWLTALPALTLTAVLTITASAEYELARTVLGLHPQIAWALPVAVDSYVLAALRSGRDVPAALAVMAGALTASMAAHLAAASRPTGAILPATVVAPAATAIMTVLVVVAWRVHVLIDHHHGETVAGDAYPAHAYPVEVYSAALTARPSTPAVPAAPTTGAAGEYTAATAALALAPAASTPAVPSATTTAARYPASTTAGTPAPTDETTTGPGTPGVLTDEQILADLDGTTPGVRALKRTYGIGQARAARLHRQMTTTTTSSTDIQTETQPAEHQTTTSTTKNQDQKTHENHSEKAKNENQTKNSTRETKESSQESTQDQEEESDTGITDRVGESSSTAGVGRTAFPVPVGAFPDGEKALLETSC